MKENTSQALIVLHVVGRLDMGGAESRVMDIYRRIDRSRIQFYFVQHTKDRGFFAEEVEELGGKIFSLPRFTVTNLGTYQKAWKRLFEENPEIRIVHGHMTSTAAIYLPLAKKMGVKLTIAHARSAGTDPGIKGQVTRFLRRNLVKKCDHCFTCSYLAGEAVFGRQAMKKKQVELIPNAIEVEKFVFSLTERQLLRQQLKLEDAFVIGHVGRFSPVKNHAYLLEILKACIEREDEHSPVKMVLLGDGPLREDIQKQVLREGLKERVLFLGNQKQIHRYYSMMDCFLLPSFYEGLPGTAIEAQTNGLFGILSDTVTKEAVVTDRMIRLSIQSKAGIWADQIMDWAKAPVCRSGTDCSEQVKKAGYDVKEQAVRLEQFYQNRGRENVRDLRVLRQI